jgi:hypothetical protein
LWQIVGLLTITKAEMSSGQGTAGLVAAATAIRSASDHMDQDQYIAETII